ncbi:MAG: DPP IV N-terminal domain-containing protein [Planctomycetota bacterium]|nr:DPP IV N-terminal domain-containing protein [Planctomycetota bacterium]
MLIHTLVAAAILGQASPTPPGDAPPIAGARNGGLDGLAHPEFLEQWAKTNRFRLGLPASISLTPKGDAVLYLRSPARSFVRDLYAFDVATGKERVLLTAESLLGGKEENLTPEELARRERMRLAARGIAFYALSEDGSSLLVPLSGRMYVLNLAAALGGTVAPRVMPDEGGFALDPRFSPDATKIACVREGDVYVIDVGAQTQVKITPGAAGSVTYGEAEFVAQEEMDRRHGFWWSPDGTRLVVQKTDTAGMELFHIADPFNPGSPGQTWPYPRAGGVNASVTLGVFSAGGSGTPVWIEWDRAEFPYVARVDWPKHGPLTVLVQNRRQTVQRLLEVNPATGATSTLLEERDDAWLNLTSNTPAWLRDGSGFLWLTEQGGGDTWRLQKRARDGTLVAALTPEGFPLNGLVHVDQARGFAVVSASEHPAHVHLYRVALTASGGTPEAITPRDVPGQFAGEFAREGDTWVRSSATLTSGPSWEVLTGGARSGAPIPASVERPLLTPEVRLEEVRWEGRTYHAAVVLPPGHDGAAKLPVVNSVYGGPHVNDVNASQWAYLMDGWLAAQGFAVVSIDARGTPRRGRAWERAIHKDVIDIPLREQTEVLKALCARMPALDASRVGISGWSFGGYFAAHATMRRPDVYKVGVAGAPVCDWIDYDTHYTERYMGLPAENPKGYASANVLTYCKDLRVPLLIIHGTADDNVYMVNSLKMTDALFRAGRAFDFLPLAGVTHAPNEPETAMRLQARIVQFLKDALRGE